jgi:hypothetical protein
MIDSLIDHHLGRPRFLRTKPGAALNFWFALLDAPEDRRPWILRLGGKHGMCL